MTERLFRWEALMDLRLFDLHAKLEETHWWFSARARIIRNLAERVAPQPPRVVEVGCGTGTTSSPEPKPEAGT